MAPTTPRSAQKRAGAGSASRPATNGSPPSEGSKPSGIRKQKEIRRISQPPLALRYLEPVKVKVMPNAEEGESKEFIVHRRLICHYSGYFAKIFGDDSSMNCAKKDNTSPRIFELFVQFIYAQDFDYKWKAWVAPEEDPYFPLVELYRLARELEVPALMNKTISTIVKLFKDFELKVFVSPQIINYIYGITNKGDPLRRVVVAMFAFHNRKKTLKFDKNLLLPAEFDAELRDMYIERLDNPNMTEPPSSAYHIHEVESDEDECIMVEKTQGSATATPGSAHDQTSPLFVLDT